MSDVMELVQNEDGTFSAYDDTYDVVIHCETEEEKKKRFFHDFSFLIRRKAYFGRRRTEGCPTPEFSFF